METPLALVLGALTGSVLTALLLGHLTAALAVLLVVGTAAYAWWGP
ncbi:hypothetical protein [Marinactinospora rubrisoli]|uniref:Uncharacterized protein n=1 Tax=Marinactinospora rubrisoli TaxID=2715399 RepID=A0ABW2KQW6_9ACTN